jgi:Secretion system C-terminal sorting domain
MIFTFAKTNKDFLIETKLKKMNKFLTIILLFISFVTTMSAQSTGCCGMTREDLDIIGQRLLENRAHPSGVQDRAIKYVPVRMILVADSDGSGRIRERKVLEMLCALNQKYESVGFRFYIENGEFKNVDDDGINVLQMGTTITKMKFYRSQKAVNFFLVDKCNYNGSTDPSLEILGYYTPSNDWLVVKEAEVTALSSTIPHEAGHFFSLNHPFNGWDQDPWPAGSTACAPAISPGGIPTEKVDGSNSTTAGDFLTDTPASYNFVLDQSDCTGNAYNGGAKDPLCVPLKNKTQADNYMDYFANCQTYKFTGEQTTAMQADLNSSARNFLDNTYSPPAESLAAPADMCISPINGEATQNFDKFTFKWNAVPGANLYFFELGLTSGVGNSTVFQKLVKTTEITVDYPFTAGLNRYWRVTPMNEYVTCMGAGITSANQKFLTGATSATVSIEGLNNWFISPNPVANASEINLNTSSDNVFEANIEISTISGQLIFSEKNHQFSAGEYNYILPTEGIGAGMYLISLVQPNSRLTKKLVVLN